MRNFNVNDVECYDYLIVPKALIFNEEFRNLSSEAKLLYVLLCEKLNFSIKNNWVDKNGDIYVICIIEEIKEIFNVENNKAIKILNELEKNNLIKKQGQSKPNLIYIHNISFKLDEGVKNERVLH